MAVLLAPAVPTTPLAALPETPRRLEPAHQRAIATLVDWQLWYWGQDINAAERNALLAYGFSRTRGHADGTQRSSAYCLRHTPDAGISLHGLERLLVWGFAITATPHGHLGDTAATSRADGVGNLVLRRHDRAARWCTQPIRIEAGTRDSLPAGTLPRNDQDARRYIRTLAAVARCCADYERWGKSALGEVHRREARHRRPRAARRRDGMPPFLDGQWDRLASHVAPATEQVG